MTVATLEKLSLAESIAVNHYDEWRESAVNEEIIRLNVKTIHDPREIDEILGRNTRRRWKHSGELTPAWYASGIDPLTDEATLQGVQVKPDKTPIGKDGKHQKYIGASGMETAPLFLRVREELFWKSVIDDLSRWVFICEGAKKAGSLLSIAIAAISVPGVTTCRKLGRLHQNVSLFARPGRNIVLAYDNDLMHKKGVQNGLEGMGRELRAAGAKVWVLLLPEGDAKGVDDFLSLHGEEEFRKLLQSPETLLTFEEWIEKKKESEAEEEILPNSRLARHLNLIRQEWGGRLRYNTLKKRVEIDGKELDEDEIRVTMAEEFDIDITLTDAITIVRRIARADEYSPVVEYLNELAAKYQNPDTSFLDNLAEKYFGTDDPIHAVYFKKFLIAAVARARYPGCKVDTVFMLNSPEQGKNKSTFFSVLFGEDFFSDQLGTDIGNKDEKMKISQYWCLEWAEFEAIYRRKDVSALKNFITNREDTFRAPYARKDARHPRPCVFTGTSNEKEVLHDPTGDRRFWLVPVLIDKIPLDVVKQDRDKIWAAADALYKSGYQWWLLDAEELIRAEKNKEYQATSYWDEVVEQLWIESLYPNFLATETIVKRLGFETAKDLKPGDNNELTKTMTRLGFVKSKNAKRVDGSLKRGWEKAEDFKKFDGNSQNPVTPVTAAPDNDSSRYTPVTPPVTPVTVNENIQPTVTPVTPPVTGCNSPEALQEAPVTALHPSTPISQHFTDKETNNNSDNSGTETPPSDKFACPPPDDYYRDFPVKPMRLVVDSGYGDITVDCTPYQKIKAGGHRLHFLFTFPSGDRAATTQKCDSLKKQDLEKMLQFSSPVKKFCQAQHKHWSKRIGEKFKVKRMNLDLHSDVDFVYVTAELTQVPNPPSTDKFLFKDDKGNVIRMDFREFSAPQEIKKGDRVKVKMMSGVPDNLAYLVCCQGVVRTLNLGVAKVEFDETINFDLHVKSIGVHHLELIND